MRKHIIAIIAAAALALCLLTGCAGRSVAQYLVVSSMAVDCSSAPITAVLEIAGEEQNDYMTLQGDSYGDIFAQAQRRSGRQVYLGAMQGVVFGGVPDGEALLSQLTALQSDSRISPNLQIAQCENAQEFYSDGADGEKLAALLTLQYTDSRRSSLKELLNLFGAEGRDGLIAWVSTGDGELILDGVVPTGGSDYTAVWKPNGFGSLLLHRQEEMRLTVTENGNGHSQSELNAIFNRQQQQYMPSLSQHTSHSSYCWCQGKGYSFLRLSSHGRYNDDSIRCGSCLPSQ